MEGTLVSLIFLEPAYLDPAMQFSAKQTKLDQSPQLRSKLNDLTPY